MPNGAGVEARKSCVHRAESQLEATLSELKSSRSKRAALQAKVASYDQRLEADTASRTGISRSHARSRIVLPAISGDQGQADASGYRAGTGKGSKGRAFFADRSAAASGTAEQPQSTCHSAAGAVLALGGGLGSAAVLESLDHSVRGSKALARLVKVPVLAVIPYMENNAERRRKRKIAQIIGRLIGGGFAAGGVARSLVLDTAGRSLVQGVAQAAKAMRP